jgi:predicted nucleic acid-binding protein
MDIVLVDTSVWINFFKGKETDASLYLKNNLSNFIIATCPVILQEILQGIVTEKEFEKTNIYFNTLTRFAGNPYELAHDSAKLYRELRTIGITVRKPNDCLIAVYAIKNNVRLLNDDRDFKLIAQHSPLKIMSFE